MDSWRYHAKVKSERWHMGEESGNAIANTNHADATMDECTWDYERRGQPALLMDFKPDQCTWGCTLTKSSLLAFAEDQLCNMSARDINVSLWNDSSIGNMQHIVYLLDANALRIHNVCPLALFKLVVMYFARTKTPMYMVGNVWKLTKLFIMMRRVLICATCGDVYV